MQKITDRDKFFWLLVEQGSMSNAQARAALDIDEKKFSEIKSNLIKEDLIEKFQRRGGGLRLTIKGSKVKPSTIPVSQVKSERELYSPFQDSLRREASENEDNALVIDTSSLRRSGKWKNPDLTKVSVKRFPLIRTTKVLITTYELKRFGSWNIEAGFEAASHRLFANYSYVVVELSRDLPVEGLDDLKQVCSQFGIGLMTMFKHYKGWRHIVFLEAASHSPSDEAVEEYLGYVFERKEECQKDFESLWESTE